MFQTKVVEEIETRMLCWTAFFKHAIYEINVEKYCSAGLATDDYDAHCILDTKGTNMREICNAAFPLQQ